VQVTILGSGSALPTHRRASAGYLVEWDGHALLLDASAGTYAAALKAGLDPERLRAVALSHFHLDHTGDLAGILWARKQTPGLADAPLRLLGPDGTRGFVECVVAAYPADWLDVAWEAGGRRGKSREGRPRRWSRARGPSAGAQVTIRGDQPACASSQRARAAAPRSAEPRSRQRVSQGGAASRCRRHHPVLHTAKRHPPSSLRVQML